MIIKTLFLVSFMIASALASEKSVPIPAALLVQSNFDFSLTRKEFRVHYGGLRAGSNAAQVSIQIYKPNGGVAHTYDLEQDEKNKKNAFQFALDSVEGGTYQVAVCEDNECSEKTPSLTEVTLTNTHTLSCEHKDSAEQDIEVTFGDLAEGDWAQATDYDTFSQTIRGYLPRYKTDNEKYSMEGSNPYYDKTQKIFHTAITHNLKQYKPFFDDATVNEYCGRKNMLSLHSHVVDQQTRKVVYRSKIVNHLSETGKQLFIKGDGGKILLESTHKKVDIPAGKKYDVLVSLCVTDKDAIESTYCTNPIKKELDVPSD